MKKLILSIGLLGSLSVFSQASLNVTFRANYTYPGLQCANICGYVDSTGKEYALVGVETGMSVVDVTNPSSPVQVYQVAWPMNNSNSLWKEIKVYKKHAYVTSEAGGGVQIVDLSALPSTTPPTPVYWTPTISGQTLGSIHALHIDTTMGNIYLYGSNIGNRGAVIASLANPVAPVYLGRFDATYVHDGYVDNDTLYACEIQDGNLEIIDCSNKTAPQVLATVQTPLRFTHNSWLTPDKKTVLTTDEKSKSVLASYDITNLSNITLLDTVKLLSTSSVVHNTHIRSDYYAVTSWYKDGFSIVDCSRPNNLITTGYYDNYAAGSGNGFSGCWGVYPFLPSGTIIASNIGDGLWVFSPNYVRGCYLEGNIKDSVTNFNLQNVNTQIVGNTAATTSTNVSGDYATGLAAAGTYTVQFSKSGYQTKIVTGVSLSNGNLIVLNRKLAPLGMGVAAVDNAQTFLTGATLFEGKTTLNYYLSNTDAGNGQLKVYDYSGNLVTDIKLHDMIGEVTLGEGWAKGIYLVTLNSGRPFRIVKAN